MIHCFILSPSLSSAAFYLFAYYCKFLWMTVMWGELDDTFYISTLAYQPAIAVISLTIFYILQKRECKRFLQQNESS